MRRKVGRMFLPPAKSGEKATHYQLWARPRKTAGCIESQVYQVEELQDMTTTIDLGQRPSEKGSESVCEDKDG